MTTKAAKDSEDCFNKSIDAEPRIKNLPLKLPFGLPSSITPRNV